MKAVLQRVEAGSVSIDGEVVGRIGRGLVILLGIKQTDTQAEVDWVASKCANLRIFSDEDGKFNLSALDVQGEILVVSQFTLYGDCRKGRRPSFVDASAPDHSEPLYDSFVRAMRQQGLRTETGRFGASMLVDIRNDGPVTLVVEKDAEV